MRLLDASSAGQRLTADDTDPDGAVGALLHLVKNLSPVTAEVSVMTLRGTQAYTVAVTSGVARVFDTWQYRFDQGPSLQAAESAAIVYVADLHTETRWPRWVQHSIDTGVRSVLSLGLEIDDGVTGALTVYATEPHAFPDSVASPRGLAGYAKAALKTMHRLDLQADQVRHLHASMVHREVIEQAKGIIMGERRCSPDEAFAVLVKMSQNSNRKVRDIAADLAHRTSHMPGPIPVTASPPPGAAVTHLQLTTGADQAGIAVIGVAGELVIDTADELLAAITARLSADPVTRMVVDLAQVSFLDMAGLSALLRARAAALQAGAALQIIRPQPMVQRVLHLTDTHLILSAA